MSTATQTWRDVLTVEDFRKVPDVESYVTAALQSQYADSPRIKGLCALFQKEIDATPQLSEALARVCDPRTASGVFLDWWGGRVGASRTLTVDGKAYRLDDEKFRFLIFYRAAANISDGSLRSIHALLKRLLNRDIFAVDYQDMTISVRVMGSISDDEAFILRHYGLLTRGAGVGFNVIAGLSDSCFGFNGSRLSPFNVGVFFKG